MKAKFLVITVVASLFLAAPGAFAKKRTIRTANGRAVVVNSGNHRHWYASSRSAVSVGVGVGFGLPFYGGYYGGYPGYGYGGYYPGYGAYYPYATTAYYPYNSYPYGYGYYPYTGSYSAPYYGRRTVYSDGGYSHTGSLVARVQQRLARGGYYAGTIDGVMGPRTRYAIRAFERQHGLPADGVIDRRLLATLGLA